MMDKTTVEMFEKAPVARAVLRNAVPAMAAMLMVLVYNLADTFFIGQTRSDILVAAVSLATPVFLIFMAVGTVFGAGGTSVISRAFGQGRGEYARKVCSFCMWSCVAVGVVLSAGFLLFMNQILQLVGASADTWEPARTYLVIVAFSGPFVLISNCFSNVFRAEGQSGRAMMGQLLGNLLNIVLDPIMILTFGWGIAGAAIATVVGNVVGAGYYILYFLRGNSSLSIHIYDLIDYFLRQCVQREQRMRVCKNCGLYFAVKGRGTAEYCDVTTDGKGRVCKEIGAFVHWSQSKEDDEVCHPHLLQSKNSPAGLRDVDSSASAQTCGERKAAGAPEILPAALQVKKSARCPPPRGRAGLPKLAFRQSPSVLNNRRQKWSGCTGGWRKG